MFYEFDNIMKLLDSLNEMSCSESYSSLDKNFYPKRRNYKIIL